MYRDHFLLPYEDAKEFSSLQIPDNTEKLSLTIHTCFTENFRNIAPHLHLCPRTHHRLQHFYETLLGFGVFEIVSSLCNPG